MIKNYLSILQIIIYAIITISCFSRNKESESFNALNILMDSSNTIGFINISDSLNAKYSKLENGKEYMRIFGLENVLNYNYYPNSVHPIEKFYIKEYIYLDPDKLLFTVNRLKELIKIGTYRRFRKKDDIGYKYYIDGFIINNKAYVVSGNLTNKNNFHNFIKNLKQLLNCETKEDIESRIIKWSSNRFDYFVKYHIQSYLYSDGYYNGKIFLFEGDTICKKDSIILDNAIISYKKEKALGNNADIDSLLLNSLQIPINPISEGIVKYKQTNNLQFYNKH